MKKLLLTTIMIFLLSPILLLAAIDKTQERIDYEVFKAKTEANLEALKSIKSQDLVKLESELEAQKSLTDQINNQFEAFGNNLTIGSTIITVLLLLIGFFAYRNAKTDAQNTAKEVTQAEVESWFDKNTAELNQEIESLRTKLKILEAEVEKHATTSHERMDLLLSDIENRTISDTKIPITDEETNALNAKVEELKSIAEAMYKYKEWNTKAYAAYHRGDYEDAAKFCGLAASSTDATDIEISRALFNKGVTQGEKLNQPDAAIATYDSLIQKFGDSQLAEVQVRIASAYVNKGVTQGEKLNQPDAAIATYDSLIQRFGDSQLAEVQVRIASAYVNIAITQVNKLDKPDAAIATYDSLIQKFGDSQHAEVQVQVAMAYVNKAITQANKLNQPEAAIAIYDSLIQKFGDSQHAEVQAAVARAYFNKAITQGDKLNQPEAEIATYDSLIQKFGDSQHAAVHEQVARAYNGVGFSNLIKAKQNWKTKAKRDVLLTKATECFNKAISKCNENNQAMILGNIVYTDWLLGNKTKTVQQLKEALKIGGEELYKGTIGDTEIHTVPPDKTFRVLLDKVWAEVSNAG